MLLLPACAPAWTGAESARYVMPSASIARVLPIDLGLFFERHYDRAMLRLNHTETGFDPAELWRPSEFAATLGAMASDGKLAPGSKAVTTYGGDMPPIPEGATAEEAAGVVQRRMADGVSFLLKFEYVSPAHRPLKWLSDALFNLTGIPASIHLYCSAAGSRVLSPHTDPYDVLVWQLAGSKAWRACVPRDELGRAAGGMAAGAAGAAGAASRLSDSQRCLLQELARESIRGCTRYSVNDTDSLRCDDFTMGAGDVLYMPKGVVSHTAP